MAHNMFHILWHSWIPHERKKDLLNKQQDVNKRD